MNKNTENMNKYKKQKIFDTKPIWMCDTCEHYYTGACDGSNKLKLVELKKDGSVVDVECRNYEECRGIKLHEKLEDLEIDLKLKNESDNKYFLADCCWNIAVGAFIILHVLGYV